MYVESTRERGSWGGGGVLPIMACTLSSTEGVTFFQLQVYKWVGISPVEVHGRVRKSAVRCIKD